MTAASSHKQILMTACDQLIARLEAAHASAEKERASIIADRQANAWPDFWQAAYRARAKLDVARLIRAEVLEAGQ